MSVATDSASSPSGNTGGESKLTVIVALGANLAVAIAKTVAALISGSASMTAEATHSWADTANQGFLIIANRRSSRPPDAQRPLGYGREAYVWSLLAAVGLFVVGGLLLGVIAVVLIDRNRRFLVGEPASPELRKAAVARLQKLPEVASVRFIRLVFVGPKQLFLVASVDLVGDAVESDIATTLRRLENQLQAEPYIVDAVLTIAEPDALDQLT